MAVCQEIPRAAATRETDIDSRARARSPHSTAERVSRVLGLAKVEAPCLHTRRQWVQAKRRRRTSSCVGRHPTGTWARRRATVPRACPWAPQALQNGSSNPTGMRHSTTARSAVAGPPRSVPGRRAQEGRQIRVGEGSLRHVEVSRDGCVETPIIGGPRPLPTATTHPPPMHFNRPRLPHPQTRRASNVSKTSSNT